MLFPFLIMYTKNSDKPVFYFCLSSLSLSFSLYTIAGDPPFFFYTKITRKMRVILSVAVLGVVLGVCSGKSVKVVMQAGWGQTKLEHEAAEHIWENAGAAKYWEFIDAITMHDAGARGAEDSLHAVLTAAESIGLDIARRSALSLALSTRYYSPRVTAIQSLCPATSHSLVAIVNNKTISDVEEIKQLSATDAATCLTSSTFATHKQLDRITTHSTAPPQFTLCASLQSETLADIISHFKTQQQNFNLRYIESFNGEHLGLEGYGVSMMIKDMEYKAMDDKEKGNDKKEEEEEGEEQLETPVVLGVRLDALYEEYPDQAASIDSLSSKIRDHAAESASTTKINLDVWEVAQIGAQASFRILKNNATPLTEMANLVQDFPRHAASVTKISGKGVKRVAKALAKAVNTNRIYPKQEGVSVLYVNGENVPIADLSTSTLLELINKENTVKHALQEVLGYLPDVSTTMETEDGARIVAAFKAIVEGGGDSDDDSDAPTEAPARYSFPLDRAAFLNDFETDAQYESWPTSLDVLLNPPAMYGAPSSPRKNVYTSINFIDPSVKSDLTIAQVAMSLYRQMAPIRIGVVFVNSDPTGNAERHDMRLKVASLFHYLSDERSPAQAFSVLYNLQSRSEGASVSLEAALLSEKDQKKIFSDPTYGTAAMETRIAADTALLKAKGLFASGGVSHLFNGIYDENNFQSVVERYYAENANIISLLEAKTLHKKEKDVLGFLLKHHGASDKRLSIVANAKTITASVLNDAKAALSTLGKQTWLYSPKFDNDAVAYSVVLLLNENNVEAAKKHLTNVVSFFTSEGNVESKQRARFTFGFKTQSDAVDQLHKEIGNKMERKRAEALQGRLSGLSFASSETASELAVQFPECPKTANCVVVNGLLIVLDDEEDVTPREEIAAEDYILIIEKVKPSVSALLTRAEAVVWSEAIRIHSETDSTVADLQTSSGIADKIFLLSTLLLQGKQKVGGAQMPRLADSASYHVDNSTCKKPCRIAFRSDFSKGKTGLKLDVIAVLDPLSIEAQKVASFLTAFAKQQQTAQLPILLDISVYLNPKQSLEEVPLKTFYRYVMSSNLKFSEEGAVSPPEVVFAGLPEKQVLTLGIHEPEPWMVTTKSAVYDLDNIKLADVSSNVLNAVFELDSIILSGSCVDAATKQPPRGLPLRLSSISSETTVDTLVMSNLGYFQLKANPGLYTLGLQEDGGKATEIFSGEGVAQEIVIDSFNGVTLELKAGRAVGKEDAVFVEEKAEKKPLKKAEKKKDEEGVLSKLSHIIYGDEEVKAAEELPVAKKQLPTLNIFSCATGHLYERFLKIMIHTTMQHIDRNDPTKNRVKFWFLNNFLSPQFKQNIHKMAEKWGFEVGLVTYKWPQWLRRQTQKQRIIWGYKVLFLDVMFPLDVDKVIYVDADQIVKADLHELYNLDLEGAPVAYTPFCIKNKNDDTFGFRFWEQGYWKDHLAGKPYHISAIYVVDLKKFRAQGAGDAYRAIYDQLSKDPASLSNLDQDLPNYSQNMVEIFSLPEHWLWCETWCNQVCLFFFSLNWSVLGSVG